MTARCPSGHDSTEPDYCSVCGAAMTAPARALSPTASPGVVACPICTEPRADREARFCEVCRYDFVAGKAGPAPLVAPSPPIAPARSVPGPVAAATAYVLVVQTDPTLDLEPDAAQPCPASPDAVIAVDRPELLVGRRDDLRDVHPDVALNDPGTSRRHGKFVRASDGALAFQDLASTNGSKLNGVDVAPGSRSAVREGDEVTLGRWTRIRVTVKA